MTFDSTDPAADRTVLGLALGGGGVRGLAHIGVLRVLERESLMPDVICGTSIGAIVAGAAASGMTVDEMVDAALSVRWNDLISPRLRRDSVFDTTGFEDFLATIITERDFDDLTMPFAAVARDKVTGERVVLTQGDPVRAAAASSAIRRAFPPVDVDGRRLVDGITVDPVPVAAAHDLGATFVVGVDVVSQTAMRRLRNRASGPATIVLDNVADIMIRPEPGTRAVWDFALARDLIDLGETAAQAVLPEITAALALSPR